jgi:hypothetical protein
VLDLISSLLPDVVFSSLPDQASSLGYWIKYLLLYCCRIPGRSRTFSAKSRPPATALLLIAVECPLHVECLLLVSDAHDCCCRIYCRFSLPLLVRPPLVLVPLLYRLLYCVPLCCLPSLQVLYFMLPLSSALVILSPSVFHHFALAMYLLFFFFYFF